MYTACPSPQGCCFDYVRAVSAAVYGKAFYQPKQPCHTYRVKNYMRQEGRRTLAYLLYTDWGAEMVCGGVEKKVNEKEKTDYKLNK